MTHGVVKLFNWEKAVAGSKSHLFLNLVLFVEHGIRRADLVEYQCGLGHKTDTGFSGGERMLEKLSPIIWRGWAHLSEQEVSEGKGDRPVSVAVPPKLLEALYSLVKSEGVQVPRCLYECYLSRRHHLNR